MLAAVRRSLRRGLMGNKEDKERRFRKETNMAQPQMARITCSLCDGWYNSERELWVHVQEVHRRSVPGQDISPLGGLQPGSFRNRFGISKEEWANLSVHLRNHVQVRFKSGEIDVIDRFILLASQGSVFDDACR
jgi:hypothetical protein